jgi:hypothetical protein
MFARIFVTSNTKDEAKNVYERFLEISKQYIKDEKIEKIEPYWKFDDMHIIETNIFLTCNIESIEFEDFLHQISDRWSFLGEPIDEAIASLTVEGCKYIIDGIEMINIFYFL